MSCLYLNKAIISRPLTVSPLSLIISLQARVGEFYLGGILWRSSDEKENYFYSAF